jgi:hypothetical protein
VTASWHILSDVDASSEYPERLRYPADDFSRFVRPTGDLDLAVEFRASHRTDKHDLKGVRAPMEDQEVRQAAVVCLDTAIRSLPGNIMVYPRQKSCDKLQAGGLL